jgi:hypothetical protein
VLADFEQQFIPALAGASSVSSNRQNFEALLKKTIMRITLVIISFFLLQAIYGQSESLLQRQEYMKKHHLFVVDVEFKQKKRDKNNLDFEKEINSNLRICLNNFWCLSDTIIYIKNTDFKRYKKEFPEHIFLNYMYKSSSFEISAFNLILPKDSDYFKNVGFRIIDNNTSLIDIIEAIRQLQNEVVKGNVLYDGPVITKRILILDEPALSDYQQAFINDLKKSYPESFDIVTRKFLEKLLLERNKDYIYANRLSLINIEDGTLIGL